MSPWLIGIAFVVALLALVVLTRRRPVARHGAHPPAAPSPLAGVALTGDPDPAPASTSSPDGDAARAAAAGEAAQAASIRDETLRALKELAFGTALPANAPLPPADPVCTEVSAALVRIVDKPNYAPRRPMQLPRLMQAINDENASRGALSQIIAGDPALAGNLLRLANSPFYRHGTEPIESLDRAVAMLGIEGLRSMIAAALLQPVFRISGGSFAHFGEITWEHSLLAANASELYAAQVESTDSFAAQLLGLLLGLAHIVVFSVARDAYLAQQRKPDAGVIGALIDAHGVGVARQIAASWELSDRIDAALAEQTAARTGAAHPVPSALGRSLQFGEFIGAVGVLRQHGALDDAAALTALRFASAPWASTERIWKRLGFMPE